MMSSKIISALGVRKLGSCPICMRISFLAMVISWLALTGAMAFSSNAALFVVPVPLGLTLLWLGHVWARAMRCLPPLQPENESRRQMLRVLGRSVAGAAALSIGALSAAQAEEQYRCGQPCSRYNDNCPHGCTCWWEWGKCVQLGN